MVDFECVTGIDYTAMLASVRSEGTRENWRMDLINDIYIFRYGAESIGGGGLQEHCVEANETNSIC